MSTTTGTTSFNETILAQETERERYARYLCSREWAERRNVVLARCGGICERCFHHPMSHVHHLTYIRKYHEQPEDLQGLCEPCHEFTHGKRDVDPISQAPPVLFTHPITSVYLAGKIREDSWRDQILGDRSHDRAWSIGVGNDDPDSEWFSRGGCPVPDSVWSLDYLGPFFLDNCGGHGGPDGPHGYGGSFPVNDQYYEGECDPVYDVDYSLIRRKSLGSVRSCDLLFAWVDRQDIPGTIAEIAFGFSLMHSAVHSPVIVIATPPGFPVDDMPFVLGMAHYRITSEKSPGAAWKHLWGASNVRRQRHVNRAGKPPLVQ